MKLPAALANLGAALKDVALAAWPFVRRAACAVWTRARAMPKSVLAWLGSLVAALLSMGLLGFGLYYLVWPALRWVFPAGLDGLPHGDSTWPSVIFAGMLWSFGFLLAGVVNRRLAARPAPVGAVPRALVYLAVLWAWALAAWLYVLATQPY